MLKPTVVLFGAVSLAAGVALAKLPPPTPEEQAAKAAAKEKQEQELQKQKEALQRAQDRVVQYYKKGKGASASSGSGQETRAEQMPKTTSEPENSVGPRPVRPFSAEAHSAPAK
jgi:hypothetical protein